MEININIRNISSGSWCWQNKDALRLIRSLYTGIGHPKRMPTGLVVYLCLTELASNNNSGDSFRAYNSTIAKMAGKSISTIKAYCNDLIKAKLLYKKTKKKGKQNFANEWFLLKTPKTPDSNNYPTPNTNSSYGLGNNNSPVIEDNPKENNRIRINPPLAFESDSYKKLKEKAYSLKNKNNV